MIVGRVVYRMGRRWSCLFVIVTATTESYTYGHTLSRHAALPILSPLARWRGELAFAEAPTGTATGSRTGTPVSSSANSSSSKAMAAKRSEGKRQALKVKTPSRQRLEIQ